MNPSSPQQPFRKYKETITDMNYRYSRLLHNYEIGDTRSEYLLAFEQALGLNLEKPLVQNPRYIRVNQVYPLDKYGYIPPRKFQAYLTLYEWVMRDNGLLGRNGDDDYFCEEDDSAFRG